MTVFSIHQLSWRLPTVSMPLSKMGVRGLGWLFLLACLCLDPSSALFAEEPTTPPPSAPSESMPEMAPHTGPHEEQLTAQVKVARRRYILGPNDILSVRFFAVPEFNQDQLRVSPDGVITLPAIGAIDVVGKTVDDVQKILEERYKTYLKDPMMAVTLYQARPFLVYVTGAVMKPGSYELNITPIFQTPLSPNVDAYIERKTPILSNILVASGGLSYDADLEHVEVYNDAYQERFVVNLLALLEGNTAQDVYLSPGDRVHVPRLASALAVDPQRYKAFASATFSPKAVPVRVFGYVKSPGLVQLDPSQSANLNSAIGAAGGYYEDFAYAPNKVYLSRVDGQGKLVTTLVNPRTEDVQLLPNDVLYVPEKALPKVARVLNYMTGLLDPAFRVAAGYNNWALIFDPTRNFRN